MNNIETENKIKRLKVMMLLSVVEMTLAVLILIYPEFVMNLIGDGSNVTPYIIAAMLFIGGTFLFYICKSSLIKLNTK